MKKQIESTGIKFMCSQSELAAHLALVSRVVPSRPTHPILNNILMEVDAENSTVTLTGFDLSLGIRTTLDAQVLQGGAITVPAKLINDIVSRLPEGEITILQREESIEIISLEGYFSVATIEASDYPKLPIFTADVPVLLSVEKMKLGIQSVAFAASGDETKQILTGVHIINNSNGLEFAATDGHRLSVFEPINEGGNEATEFQITIPAKALRELDKMMATTKGSDVVLNVDDSQVVFELGQQQLTCRKLDGAYPAYKQLMPTEFSRRVTVNRKQLMRSLELVSVLATNKTNVIKFAVDAKNRLLSLSIDAKEVGNGSQTFPAVISGDSIEIGFNGKYLMDGLKSFSGDDVVICANESLQPVIFTPLGSDKVSYLVMPVQIRD